MIKNREIFLVQLATKPFPEHIYRSLRALLNSNLTRNEFGSFQTQTIHKIEGSKPCIYTFYTKTRQIHTIVQKSTLFHTELNKFHTHLVYIQIFIVPYKPYSNSIHVIFFFLPFFLLFSSSSSSSSHFCSLFPQDQNDIFILVLSLFDIIPFLFHFSPPTLLIFTNQFIILTLAYELIKL